MVDRQTRDAILKDPSLPIHREYRGLTNTKDILEMMLMGYGTMEIVDELGIPKASLQCSTKRLREKLGYSNNRLMLRGLVKKYRGYL